ncbi:MAG: 30S ribosomal protein S20 [Candidatus Parcubacteria bacterium]|nr:30S ribosomal protein S20 [Candidatus Parcubacteria bacterium]
MPITKSAKKALRQSLKRKAGNKVYKEKIKSLFKEAKILVSKKKIDEAKKLLPQIYQALDKAAKVGVIKKNNASRRKMRFANLLQRSK